MKNVGIITINHLRFKVFELWAAQIKRLRHDLDTFIPAVCVADEDEKPICRQYDIAHVFSANQPVSEKFNKAFKYMQSIGVSYCMILGSDDIISTDLMRAIIAHTEMGTSLIGVDTIYFYCGEGLDRGKLVRLKTNQMLGVAKTISKDILDKVAWQPFLTGIIDPATGKDKGKNWGIDALCTQTIRPYVTTKAIVEGIVVDVKTKTNLNKHSLFSQSKRLPPVDSNIFYDILSEEEKVLLAKI